MKSIFKVSGKRVEVVVEDGEITTCKVFNTDGSMNWIEIKDGIIATNENAEKVVNECDMMYYNYIFIPLWKFITNRKISSVYCNSNRILARNVQ